MACFSKNNASIPFLQIQYLNSNKELQLPLPLSLSLPLSTLSAPPGGSLVPSRLIHGGRVVGPPWPSADHDRQASGPDRSTCFRWRLQGVEDGCRGIPGGDRTEQPVFVAIIEKPFFSCCREFPSIKLGLHRMADDLKTIVAVGREEKLFVKATAAADRTVGCTDASHCYLILQLDCKLTKTLLVNAFTGKELALPVSPFPLNCITLTTSPSIDDCRVLAFARNEDAFLLTGPRCSDWTVLRYGKDVWPVHQMAFLDGKVYGFTPKDRLVVIDLAASPFTVTLLQYPSPTYHMNLVVMDQQLFLLDLPFYGPNGAKGTALRLNALRNQWVPVDNFGGRTLFMSYWGTVLCKLGGWSDQIVFMEPPCCYIFSLSGSNYFTIKVSGELADCYGGFWFLPELCYS